MNRLFKVISEKMHQGYYDAAMEETDRIYCDTHEFWGDCNTFFDADAMYNMGGEL